MEIEKFDRDVNLGMQDSPLKRQWLQGYLLFFAMVINAGDLIGSLSLKSVEELSRFVENV